jgi:hypothetical protein
VKYYLSIILLSFTLSGLFGQEGPIWLDQHLKPCKKNNGLLYMKVAQSTGAYELEVMDKSHNKIMKGQSLDPKGTEWNGNFEFYHPDGNIESRGLYQEGAKVGVWERFDSKGNQLAERMYAAFDHKSMAYFYVDQMPVYRGGEKKFQEFLKLSWKEIVNDNVFLEKDGPLELSFIVTEKGSVVSPRFTQGVSAEWDAKALNLLTVIPDWVPGKNQGENVRVKVRLLIELWE